MVVSKIWVGALLVGVLMGLTSTTWAYDFYVGGKDGWVEKPSEGYNHWAGRMRFQVNDSLVFKYKKGDNSVLVVKKDDYDTCNTTNPIQRLDGGDSVYKLYRSGPFFFISGKPDYCKNGQKIIVVVLAIRTKPGSPPPGSPSPPPSIAPSPAPTSKPPTVSPVPSPSSHPPSHTPSPSPSPSPPSPSSSKSPSPSPSTGEPVSPPVQPPVPNNEPGSAPAPAPSTPAPSSSALTAPGLSFGLVALVLGGALLS